MCEMMEMQPLKTPLKMSLVFSMPIPVSYSKKRTQACLDRFEKYTKKPDIDNLAKTIMDALNGICYDDDSQIVRLIVDKVYSNEPRVSVVIDEYLC
jgi:Holliday junction resolvase RusA-like endonuclease